MPAVFSVRGDRGIRLHLNKIERNLPRNFHSKLSKEMMKMQMEAQELILSNATGGSGKLASNIEFLDLSTDKEISLRLVPSSAVDRYAKYVHSGFRPHWVKISNKPELQDWIARNLGDDVLTKLLKRDRMLVGAKTPWNPQGIKFFKIPFDRFMRRRTGIYLQTIKESMKK